MMDIDSAEYWHVRDTGARHERRAFCASGGVVMRRARAALLAGLGGGLAYLAAQEIDRRMVNPRSNDLVLLGGLVTDNSAVWRPLGLVMHLLASATFGLLFETMVAPRLPGPYWLRGVIMAQTENVTLWPLVLLIDRTHIAVKRGD